MEQSTETTKLATLSESLKKASPAESLRIARDLLETAHAIRTDEKNTIV